MNKAVITVKKTGIILTAFMLLITTTVSAFELENIYPDDGIYEGKNVTEDMQYFNNLAYSFSDKYIVEKLDFADVSDIDKFFDSLNADMTLKEIDEAKLDFNFNKICDMTLYKNLYNFKMFGGLGDYSIRFNPILYYRVHRDITLVGGYCDYTRLSENVDTAYWKVICQIENVTREVIDYNTRLSIYDSVKKLDDFVTNDNKFKIFVLIKGKVDSVWEV